MKIDREKFLAETLVRIKVQSILREKREITKQYMNEQRKEVKFRKHIHNVLREAKKSSTPYGSTGVSILADTLKKINPIIHDDFMTLTTDVEQRRSFRAHIINGFKNALAPLRSLQHEPTEKDLEAPLDGEPEVPSDNGLMSAPGMMQEAPGDIDNDGIPDAQEKFIETDPDKEAEEEKKKEIDPEQEEMDQFSVDDEDETGRNMALQTFKKVEKTIVDAYALLSNEKDREEFYEYGIINMKLYFDRWEEELQNEVQEFRFNG